MKLQNIAVAVVLVVSGIVVHSMAAQAQPGLIFDGGSPNLVTGVDSSDFINADDFALTSNSNLQSVKFWTLEFTPGSGNLTSTWDGNIQYYLFNNAGNQPSATAFASGVGVNIVKTATGRVASCYNPFNGTFPSCDEYSYTFNLDNPEILASNTKYWVGLHLNSPTNFKYSNLYWETTSNGYGSISYHACGFGSPSINACQGGFSSWTDNTPFVGSSPNQLAFELFNTPVTAVPEPKEQGLIVLGVPLFLGIRILKNRKS